MTLRRRLLLLVLGLSAIGLVTAGATSVVRLRSYVLARVDRQLETLANDARNAPFRERGRGTLSCADDGPDELSPPLVEGVVSQARVDGERLCDYDQFAADPGGGPKLTAGDFQRQGIFTLAGNKPGHEYRVTVRSISGLRLRKNGAVVRENATVFNVYAVDLAEATTTWKNQALTAGIVGAATLALLGLAALVLVRRDLRPLERVTTTAEEIAQGDLTRRVEIAPSASEVGRLGTAFNTMVSSIERAFGEQQRSEQKLRRFVADASHELRTPLTSIRGYAELERVGGADTPEKRATVMRHIEREARRMGGLVEDMLLLAKLDEEPPLRLGLVDLARVASDAVHDLQAVEPDRPVELAVDGSVEITADEARMRQIVANLLGNVRSHTPAGTPVRVTVTRDGDDAIVRVADYGPGIPPDRVDEVFERFARLDPSRARTSGGSGLGLAIVRALVEAHGGTVTVEPTPGGGATFVVRMPVVARVAAAPGAPSAQPDPSARIG